MAEEKKGDVAVSGAGAGAGAGAGSDGADEGRLTAISNAIKELYDVKDKFFTKENAEKQARLQKMVDAIVTQVTAIEPSGATERASVAYFHGKALDALEGYNKEAEEKLSVAVKLDPSRIDAWNTLGNCLWKKKDLKAAMACFTGAAKQAPNAASLRQLSMLMRQMGDTPKEVDSNIKDSVGKAKEAVALDLADSESWYVLGNAYLAKFFSCDHLPEDLSAAMKAYQRADKSGDSSNPDLHFNRANVLMFQEEYAAAADGFRKAASIDPSLPGDDNVDGIERHVVRMANLVSRKAKMKAKKLKALAKSLPSEEVKKSVEESKDAAGRAFVPLTDLVPGVNKGKMVLLKLLITAIRSEHPPWNIVVVDEETNAAGLSLYHLDAKSCERLSSKDIFIVVDPFVKVIEYTAADGSTVSYPCIQVLHPEGFYRNGRSVTGSFAHAAVKISNFDH